MPARTRQLLAALLTLTFLTSGCGPTTDAEPRSRVLVIGIDGASLRVLEPLIAAGRLPNLARIAKAGASGPLRSNLPLRSPRIWTTVATGRLPEQHGILNFFYHAGDGQRHLYASSDREVPALWNIVSHRGLNVGVVNWWTTFPPERISGVMVSDHFLAAHMEGIREHFSVTGRSEGPITFPRDWIEGTPALLQEAEPPSQRVSPFADLAALPHWVADVPMENGVPYLPKVHRDDTTLTKLALAIESELDPALLMVLLIGIDRVSHILWATLEPEELYPVELRPTPEARAAGAEALRQYYEYTDDLIGALASRYGPDDTVLVLSDHGFEADVSSETVTGGHKGARAIDGVLFARGPGIPPGSSSQSTRVVDITPTVLTQLGLPVADDMDGRVAPFVTTPIERIPSYADVPMEVLESGESAVEAEIIERLRALGYGD